jgi:hypothetical protein
MEYLVNMTTAATQMVKNKAPESARESHEQQPPEKNSPSRDSRHVEKEARDPNATAQLAYSYWEARGRSGGSAEQDWFEAELELYGPSIETSEHH